MKRGSVKSPYQSDRSVVGIQRQERHRIVSHHIRDRSAVRAWVRRGGVCNSTVSKEQLREASHRGVRHGRKGKWGQSRNTDAHPVDTPMVLGLKIHHPNPEIPVTSTISTWMEHTPYCSLIGTLNYLAIATRPNITYAVGHLASVLDCYRSEHWDAAICVIRYLKGTRLFSLKLGGFNSLWLLGFTDLDYANCPDTSCSVGGYCFTLGSGMISCASRKQQHASDSTCYSEYIAMHEASHELLFF